MSVLQLNTIIEESFAENKSETLVKKEYISEDVKLGLDLQSIVEGKINFEKPKEKSKLNVQLESIQELSETKEHYNQKLIDRVAAAFTIDRLVEESIIENIIDELENVSEAQGIIKNVVRSGEVKEKLFCPPGFKALNDKCVKMSPQEVMSRKKAAKIAIRTRKSSFAKNRIAIAKSRKKSMKVRDKKEALMAKTRVGG